MQSVRSAGLRPRYLLGWYGNIYPWAVQLAETSTSKAGCRMIATAVCATNDWLKARVLCCRRCRAMFPPLKQAETKIYGCQSGSCTLRTNCHEMGE